MEIDNQKVLISAIIVALVVLVSFNFEKITGQATVEGCKSNSRIITAPTSVSAGSSFTTTVTPRTGTMNLGGATQEQLWIKGSSYTTEITNYECVDGYGYTNNCKKATARTSISGNEEKGAYYLTVEQSLKTGRCVLGRETITVN